MSTITFDTFKFVERLEKAGISREQAAAIVEAQKDAFAEALDTSVATKSDIVTVRADIARLENRIDGMSKDMQAMELRLVIKLGAFFGFAVGALALIMRFSH